MAANMASETVVFGSQFKLNHFDDACGVLRTIFFFSLTLQAILPFDGILDPKFIIFSPLVSFCSSTLACSAVSGHGKRLLPTACALSCAQAWCCRLFR